MTNPLRFLPMLAIPLGFAACWGCSRSPLRAPKFDPVAAAREAMSEFDANKDGFLDADELKLCPSLLAAKSAMDKDGDGRLSESEILTRLKSYQTGRSVATRFGCGVLCDKEPLANATITLVPEKFLGPAFKPASGISMPGGRALLSDGELRAKGLSGVYTGLYRVQVSCKDADGTEKIPSRFNVESMIGQEIVVDAEQGQSVLYEVTGKSSSDK